MDDNEKFSLELGFSGDVAKRFQPKLTFSQDGWDLEATIETRITESHPSGRRNFLGLVAGFKPFKGSQTEAVSFFDGELKKLLRWSECDLCF